MLGVGGAILIIHVDELPHSCLEVENTIDGEASAGTGSAGSLMDGPTGLRRSNNRTSHSEESKAQGDSRNKSDFGKHYYEESAGEQIYMYSEPGKKSCGLET